MEKERKKTIRERMFLFLLPPMTIGVLANRCEGKLFRDGKSSKLFFLSFFWLKNDSNAGDVFNFIRGKKSFEFHDFVK